MTCLSINVRLHTTFYLDSLRLAPVYITVRVVEYYTKSNQYIGECDLHLSPTRTTVYM